MESVIEFLKKSYRKIKKEKQKYTMEDLKKEIEELKKKIEEMEKSQSSVASDEDGAGEQIWNDIYQVLIRYSTITQSEKDYRKSREYNK